MKSLETGYWRLGRFITIIVVISIVLIVRQEDPDKIQDARGLLKSIGLQTPYTANWSKECIHFWLIP